MKPDQGGNLHLSPLDTATSAAIAKVLQGCWWAWKHRMGTCLKISSWKHYYCSHSMPSGDEISSPAEMWVTIRKLALFQPHLLGKSPNWGNKSAVRLHLTRSWVQNKNNHGLPGDTTQSKRNKPQHVMSWMQTTLQKKLVVNVGFRLQCLKSW